MNTHQRRPSPLTLMPTTSPATMGMIPHIQHGSFHTFICTCIMHNRPSISHHQLPLTDVSICSSERQYIASMGPLDNTIEAFWRMVWMADSPAVVMTTPMSESGVIKCARYWPTVRYNVEKKCGDKKWGSIRVAVMKGQRHPGYILTELRVSKGSEHKTVNHYWFTDWPDHGVPANTTNVIMMLRDVRRHCASEGGRGPPVVHCSAGIGRTGTFIAIDHCIRLLEDVGKVEPLDVINNLRLCRGGMVQHPQQYECVQSACIQYAKMAGKPFKTVADEATEDPDLRLLSISGSKKKIDWKASIKSKKPSAMVDLITHGKPEDMPESEWKKVNRKYRKQQATIRARHSIRRKPDDAEMAGELRLGTLSGGTSDGKYRPSAREIFEDK
eukprot:m.237413 g.237413  ORF g.237413 m.237413 type:complete len:385 (+) comp15269_c0_seq2:1230-2384(+)